MPLAKELTISKVNTKTLSHFVLLSGVALFLPFYIHIQWISGPIVNAVLIITLFLVGIRSALLLCLVPSLMALAGGLLPAILAPAVPFIMISNVILVLCVEYFYQNIKDANSGYFVGVFAGAIFKYAFLFFSINIVSKLLLKQELASKIAQLFSWTQFITALSGGLIAWGVLKYLKRV